MSDKKESVAYHSSLITHHSKETYTVKPSAKISFALFASLLFTLALSVSPTSAAGDTNWPQWRGPDGSGVSAEKGLPEEWGEAKNVRWKTPLPGRGHSSPVVWGKRVFVTTAVEGPVVPGAKAVEHRIEGQVWKHPDSVGADRKHAFKVVALDRDTGRVLWEQTAWEGTPYDDRHRKSSYASATPATDGQRVYAFFDTEGLYASDFSGKLAWKAHVGKLANSGVGGGISPGLYENPVIVQGDEE